MKGLASRSSSPFSATLQTPSEQRFPAGLVCARKTISAWCYLKCDPKTQIWWVERRGWGGETGGVVSEPGEM